VGQVDHRRERLAGQTARFVPEDRRCADVRVGDRAVLVEREQAVVRPVERRAEDRRRARP
jgi:hypothetical protein